MFCSLLSQIKCSINICTMNGWMDRHVCLRVLESSGHGIFPVFIWDLQVSARLCLSPLDPGWLGPEGPVLGGGGQAGRGRTRQRSSPRPRIRNQTYSKEPATGCTVLSHCPLVTGAENSASSASRGPLVPLATELWLSLNGDGLEV